MHADLKPDTLPDRLPASAPQPALQVDELHVHYDTPDGRLDVLNGLSFSLRDGEIGCLLGSSGCGKTTALRAVAGFVHPSDGRIHIGGRTVSDSRRCTEPESRGVGVVFQDYALFPHLDLAANVAFGLRRLTPAERRARVAEMLELVGLPAIGERYPHELSGGQQQRVALARALAPAPSILLLDEPFSNLDPDLRERLALDLRDILQRARITALLVTHDQYEAFALADRVGVMHDGRIEQWDSPYRLYHQPQTRRVADFVGLGSFLPGRIHVVDGRPEVSIELGSLPIRTRDDQAMAATQASASGEVQVLLRPDDVIHDDDSAIRAEVVRKAFRGASFLYTLRLPSGATLLALVPSHHDHAIGERIGIRFDADHVVTFPIGDGD
ncbi:MAG: ABC transporter ATP-binding protein [Burkholderiaceae bacterium]|nr:ABC transporter ATP-binding protein [Burkholderiaceae bacterium]MEB2319862.1 ABC transporter ATP-binding protein [Pseudomonadota bacterium]